MNTDYINNYIKAHLSEKRKVHTYGVLDTALKLSSIYGCDSSKVEVAALCHDLFRGIPKDELNKYVKDYGLSNIFIDNPNLAHGKIAAIAIQDEFDIHDKDIINAVSYHTTGRAGMSLLEKIIYIADAIEPNRDYPEVETLRKLAFRNLDEAVLYSLEHTIDYVKSQGNFLDQDTLAARDCLLQKEKING